MDNCETHVYPTCMRTQPKHCQVLGPAQPLLDFQGYSISHKPKLLAIVKPIPVHPRSQRQCNEFVDSDELP